MYKQKGNPFEVTSCGRRRNYMTSPRLSGDSVRSYLRDIGRIPLLEHEEEILLGRQVQRLMEINAIEDEDKANALGITPASEITVICSLRGI